MLTRDRVFLQMIISKPAIIFHIGQAFFNFLAMCCMASVASFQAKFDVGPSGLSGFAIFISVLGILLPVFLLLVPVIDVKYGRLQRLARALSEVRVGFILSGAGSAIGLLIAFIVTISAWTQAGCKNPDNDPHAKDRPDGFKNGLSGWCGTKKAAAIFFWLAFGFWAASLVLNILDWRNGRTSRPRDPPFQPPVGSAGSGVEHYEAEADDDYESTYEHVQQMPASGVGAYSDPYSYRDNSNAPESPFADTNRPAGSSNNPYVLPPIGAAPSTSPSATSPQGRPSMDAYGAFSDPAPSGFGAASGLAGATPSGVSRTMQLAASDPYAAVRASIAGSSPPNSITPPGPSGPPSYDYSTTGYR